MLLRLTSPQPYIMGDYLCLNSSLLINGYNALGMHVQALRA
jgi:hypothetical protein